MSTESVDTATRRLHALLVDAMRAARRDHSEQPVTVAEIYQDLVPYSDVRDELGLGLNADYENALLRLLAGEAGDVRIEPEEIREKLSAELESPNPDVGLFRQYAACDVRVGLPPAGSKRAGGGGPALDGGGGRTDPQSAKPAVGSSARGDSTDPGEDCTDCGRPLPPEREIHFCPYCGANQARDVCGSCGERVEYGWSYCIACGTAVAPA